MRFTFDLSHDLGMTRQELLRRTTSLELEDQMTYYRILRREQDERDGISRR